MSSERDTAPEMPDEAEPSSEKRARGLWGLMRSPPDAAEVVQDNEQEDETSKYTEPTPVAEADAAVESRSLWSVMNETSGVEAETVSPDDEPPSIPDEQSGSDGDEASDSERPRGLWSVMSGLPTVKTVKAVSESEKGADDDDENVVEELDEEEVNDDETSEEAEAAPVEIPVSIGATTFEAATVSSDPRRSIQAVFSLLAGLLAVPLAGLAYFPEFTWKLPASALGFGALAAGFLAWNEIGRSRGRRTGRLFAIIGMLLGIVGMFLGPLVVTPLGQDMRRRGDRDVAIEKQKAIGLALQRYHGDNDRFPAGGIFAAGEDGRPVPMHGWMTALLPYMGEISLHRSVHFDQPYDAPVNQPAFTRDVEAFYSAGSSRRKIGRGLAVAHFAGVGGRALYDEQVGLVDLGIFDRNSKVTSDDITDGASQTLIVGEVGTNFAPWGDPENWRGIGRGLNRELTGFGNADSTGAVFLKADGSAKFYSNKISREVLERLSSRNGEDRFSRDAIP